MNCNRWAFLLTDRRIGLSLCVAPHLVPCCVAANSRYYRVRVRTMFVHSCSLESSMQLLQNVYAARQRKPNQCSDFYFPVLLQVAANCAPHYTPNCGCHSGCCKPAAACCCLLPVSIHLSSVTLGGTEAACEYLSESVALVSTTAATTSATLPYLSPR